jgi:hypothetical protein
MINLALAFVLHRLVQPRRASSKFINAVSILYREITMYVLDPNKPAVALYSSPVRK